MNLLAIDILTVFGMPPVDVVHLAADLGCRHISASLTPVPWNPCNYPSWSLRDDLKLRRELQAVMADQGVSVRQAEGFAFRPGQDVRNLASDMDTMKELGAIRLSTVSMEPDMPRGLSQLALLAEMAGERGMGLTLEFAPPHPIGNLTMALGAQAWRVIGTGRNPERLH